MLDDDHYIVNDGRDIMDDGENIIDSLDHGLMMADHALMMAVPNWVISSELRPETSTFNHNLVIATNESHSAT